MKHLIRAAGLALILLASGSAFAADKIITLKVDGMTCGSCPYQVQSALKRVDGVTTASASLETREAVVTFDDARTNVAALTKATADAGFPSVLQAAGSAVPAQ